MKKSSKVVLGVCGAIGAVGCAYVAYKIGYNRALVLTQRGLDMVHDNGLVKYFDHDGIEVDSDKFVDVLCEARGNLKQ